MYPNQNNQNPYGHYQQNQNPGYSNPNPYSQYQQPNQYQNNGPYPSNPNYSNQGFNQGFYNPYPSQNYQQPYPQNQMGQYQNQYTNNSYPNQMMNNNPYPNQGYGNQSFAMQIINNYADSIFDRHDNNRSGKLDVREIQGAVAELFNSNNLPCPNPQQVLHIMKSFDNNGDGLIDKGEFRQLLLKLTN